jgi:superfamily II DNA/RNA helicase
VLVATPGRLEDPTSRRLVALDRLQILVLDEADRMLDIGFQPQVDKTVARRTFTASAAAPAAPAGPERVSRSCFRTGRAT